MTVLARPIGWVRGLVDLVFPRGAVVLSVLSLGYFAMGLIRNRVFANTFGAGAELDAYNAAFRIPEIALDVLVAAGLTAPFVPIFTSLRRTDEARRERLRPDRPDRRDRDHGRRPRPSLRSRRRWLGRRASRASTRRPGPCTSTCCGSTASPRSCSPRRSPWARSSSPTGDSSFYALAPILYTGRHRPRDGPVRRAVRDLRDRLGGRGRRRGASRDPRHRHPPDVVPDPAGLRASGPPPSASSSG